ncbi:hypothetical protein GCM10009623_26750 [Nocardioides aestuarii]|uniref:GAF domain-containing protein n=1 Tax=Nocardioides aestuarii TaxID=252231 RepID=A0ABW4TQQ5_9ACTN
MTDAYRAPMTDAAALERGVVGIRAAITERDHARLARFCAVPDRSFMWTRLDGDVHLGRVAGPCRTSDDPAYRAAELVHVRPCEWLGVPVDPLLVPEQVAYAFSRGGRNFQRIGLPGAADATAAVWERLS